MTGVLVRELRIPLRHLTLAAKAWGNPALPPILAVHGWLDNAATFDCLSPMLEGHYLVAIDLAGHGRSDHRPPATWYPYADFLDEIGQVIAHFGWPSVDLLGHSLGATLVSTFAAMFPQQVRRLLLIEGLGPLTQAPEKTLEQMRRAYSARASFKTNGLRVFANLDEAVAARCRSGSLSEAAARCIVERGVKRVDAGISQSGSRSDVGEDSPGTERDSEPESKIGQSSHEIENCQGVSCLSWSSDPQLTIPSSSRLTEAQLAAVLPAIEAPTCLILAEPAAPYLAPALMEARVRLLRDIEVVRLSGTHHLHLEDAEPVADVLQKFLATHPVQSSVSSQTRS